MNLRRRLSRSESGQALAEFALVVPVLLLMLIGVIEFGRAWNSQQVLTDAAREGCRQAVVFDPAVTQADVEFTIKNAMARAALDSAAATITFPNGFKTGAGNLTVVRITYPYQFRFLSTLIALASASPGGVVTLATEFTMRNEG